jgi:4-diphosphocytidyl-2-C-methyl-D-erythritol kinase
MVEWSAVLGSDITFFLSRGTAYCTGRGEIMTPMDPPLAAGTKLVICKPNVGLSTPAVFKSLDYDLLSDVDPDTLLANFMEEGVETIDGASYINDLEAPAFSNLPELKTLKEELTAVAGFQHVMMSGSGTSIFCIGNPEDGDAFEKKFGQREDLQVFFAEFINRPEGVWYERP